MNTCTVSISLRPIIITSMIGSLCQFCWRFTLHKWGVCILVYLIALFHSSEHHIWHLSATNNTLHSSSGQDRQKAFLHFSQWAALSLSFYFFLPSLMCLSSFHSSILLGVFALSLPPSRCWKSVRRWSQTPPSLDLLYALGKERWQTLKMGFRKWV